MSYLVGVDAQFCPRLLHPLSLDAGRKSRRSPTQGPGNPVHSLLGGYSRTTVPPTASRAALIFSASALATLAYFLRQDSTSFFACQRVKSEPNLGLGQPESCQWRWERAVWYTELTLDEVDALDIVLDLLDQLHLVHGLCLCQGGQ